MIRLLGGAAILASVAIISFKVGWEAAMYHGSIAQLADAARLRITYLTGVGQ